MIASVPSRTLKQNCCHCVRSVLLWVAGSLILLFAGCAEASEAHVDAAVPRIDAGVEHYVAGRVLRVEITEQPDGGTPICPPDNPGCGFVVNAEIDFIPTAALVRLRALDAPGMEFTHCPTSDGYFLLAPSAEGAYRIAVVSASGGELGPRDITIGPNNAYIALTIQEGEQPSLCR